MGCAMLDLLLAYACALALALVVGLAIGLRKPTSRKTEEDDLAERARRAAESPGQSVRQGVGIGVGVAFMLGAALTAGKPLVLVMLLVLCVAAFIYLPKLILEKMARRRQDILRSELPDALDMIANSLRAGLTLPQAISRNLEKFPEHIADEFARILYDTRLGYSISAAFDNLGTRLPIQDVRMVVIASKIGVARGGDIAETYATLSDLIRDGLAFENELRAMTTEGRMQALVMSCLPFALLLILLLIRKEMMLPFFTTAAGLATLLVMTTMQVIAYVWIRKIVDVKL